MVELDTFLLSEFFGKEVVKLLLVGSILQSVADQIDLAKIQLNIIPAADHRQDRDRFLALIVSVLLRLSLILIISALLSLLLVILSLLWVILSLLLVILSLPGLFLTAICLRLSRLLVILLSDVISGISCFFSRSCLSLGGC